MSKFIFPILFVLSLALSGLVLKTKSDEIMHLNARIEEIEASSIADKAHFERELERQAYLKQLSISLKELNDAAEKDLSGADFMFGPDRLQRLNSIK